MSEHHLPPLPDEYFAEERRARVLKSQISNRALPLSRAMGALSSRAKPRDLGGFFASTRLRARLEEIVFWLIVAATLAGCVEIVVRFF